MSPRFLIPLLFFPAFVFAAPLRLPARVPLRPRAPSSIARPLPPVQAPLGTLPVIGGTFVPADPLLLPAAPHLSFSDEVPPPLSVALADGGNMTPPPPLGFPAGRPMSSADAVRMANFARQQAVIGRYIAPVLTPLNRYLNTPLVGGAPSTSRILIALNPANFELVFERQRSADSVDMETLIRQGSDSLIDRRFISSAGANDAANLARLYADSLAVDPARMTDAQKADMALFIATFKALQDGYRAAWEASVAGRNPTPDPAKPYQQALFALNRVLTEAYANTAPGSAERAHAVTILMGVAEHATITNFIGTYLVPKTGAEMLADAADEGKVTIVDATGEDGMNALVDAIRRAIEKEKEAKNRFPWNIASELRFYGLGIRYLPSATARSGRDVQVFITDGPHAGHYMWLADYIRAGYPRDF